MAGIFGLGAAPVVKPDAGASYPWGAGGRDGYVPYAQMYVGRRPVAGTLGGLGMTDMTRRTTAFADSSQTHAPGSELKAEGIFSDSRHGRWGPGQGIFASTWAMESGMHAEPHVGGWVGYAGANVVPTGTEFREHGVMGIGQASVASPWKLPTWAVLGGVAALAYFLWTRLGSTIRANQAPALRHRRTRKWIRGAVRKPGAYRTSVERRYGTRAFDESGRIRHEYIRRDLRHPNLKIRRMANLARTLRAI